jgi:transcriptional regulator with XRE-family HTH domain
MTSLSNMMRLPLPRTSPEPLCGALAAVLRRRRERAGWSLNDLAVRTNLSHSMINFVETQQRVPTMDTIARISRAFGMPCSKLLAEAENKL